VVDVDGEATSMAGRGLFGQRPAGAVTIVETPVLRSYARRARIAFFALTPAMAAMVGAVLATVMDPAQAVVLGLLCGLVVGLVVGVVVQVWPVLRALWHWAVEIGLSALLVGGAAVLASAVGWPLSLATVAVLAGSCAAVGPVRRRLVAWGWCAVVRHRLRLCFAEVIRSANRVRPGSLPMLLLARPTPAGERVWVWLRPGLDLSDLEGRADKLAVACWAREVRVVRASDRFAALVRVDVTRRDPLTDVFASPLVGLVPRPTGTTGSAGAGGVEGLALDLPDVPEEIETPPATRQVPAPRAIPATLVEPQPATSARKTRSRATTSTRARR
jgi:hypothetical protein